MAALLLIIICNPDNERVLGKVSFLSYFYTLFPENNENQKHPVKHSCLITIWIPVCAL